MIPRREKGASLPSAIKIFKLAVLDRTMVKALFPNLIRALREKLIKREMGF
jgi:hypothetical protein